MEGCCVDKEWVVYEIVSVIVREWKKVMKGKVSLEEEFVERSSKTWFGCFRFDKDKDVDKVIRCFGFGFGFGFGCCY